MKTITRVIGVTFLLSALMLMYGCPVGLDFPPDEPGSKIIDRALIGTWNCVSDTCSDLKKVKVEEYNNFSFDITVLETGSDYMADSDFFEGYVTQIEGRKFIYAEEPVSGQYYIYCYEISGNKLTIFDVALLDGGIEAVTSTEALRNQIAASLGKPGCISGRLDFARME